MTDAAPDLLRPVVGYRAWQVGRDGALLPFSVTAGGPWVPGVNVARCHAAAWAGGRPAAHAPPDPGCMCGLYALADPRDPRLSTDDPAVVVGAIVAWGDMEVHRTGVRASHAGIVALGAPARRNPEGERRRAAAAARYGVEVVPRELLEATAARFGDPVPGALLPGPPARAARPPEGAAPPARPAAAGGTFGLHLEEHTWVRPGGPDHAVAVGLTAAWAARLAPGPVDLTPPLGRHPVRAGDVLARLRVAGGRAQSVWAPLSGQVAQVNPQLADDPGVLLRDPEGSGWLARILPSAWAQEAGELAWGPAARRRYAARVRAAGAFAALEEQRVAAGGPRDWGGVLRELRRRRARGPFSDRGAVEAGLAAPLRRALADDPVAARRLARLDLDVALELASPPARLVLACRPPLAHVPPEGDLRPAGLRLEMPAATAQAFLQGAIDLPRALRRQEIVSSWPMHKTLAAASVLTALPRLTRQTGAFGLDPDPGRTTVRRRVL